MYNISNDSAFSNVAASHNKADTNIEYTSHTLMFFGLVSLFGKNYTYNHTILIPYFM